jgi:hypothetical protein
MAQTRSVHPRGIEPASATPHSQQPTAPGTTQATHTQVQVIIQGIEGDRVTETEQI